MSSSILLFFAGFYLIQLSTCHNVLFIMFDDLRPELSIYGLPHMITPNFERLAAKGVVFENAYCQVRFFKIFSTISILHMCIY
jgi:hypothetical protein